MSERDKYLTEAMGECWHETTFKEYQLEIEGTVGEFIERKCSCGKILRIGKKYTEDDTKPLCSNTNHSTWKDFGKLWEWSQEQKWWPITTHYGFIEYEFVDPDRFAELVYNRLKSLESP